MHAQSLKERKLKVQALLDTFGPEVEPPDQAKPHWNGDGSQAYVDDEQAGLLQKSALEISK